MHSDTVARCMYSVSSDTLVWLASGLNRHCVKKQGWVVFHRTAHDLCLSLVRTGMAAMRQDCNFQLNTTKLGRKMGKKNE